MTKIQNRQNGNRGHELLAPAGSYETLKAVVAAGADAVYVGGSRFGARAYADNLTEEQLLEAIDFCHLRGKKLYLTVNTLLKDRELTELRDYLLPYYRQGLDAVIVQDMGVLGRIRREFPDLPVHASTQMTVTGSDGAAYLKRLGVSRVVTARELSLAELRRIHDETNIEIECFIHGALCYCYSGQCLLSSMIGGRSGNRGRCAQPCRLPYEVLDQKGRQIRTKGAFVLSPKDLCTIEHLPELAECGVYSFKIEGRMKQTAYAAGVVSVYRKYLDGYLRDLEEAYARRASEQEAEAYARERYRVSGEDLRLLLALGSRSGFTEGYFFRKNGSDMITFERPNHVKQQFPAGRQGTDEGVRTGSGKLPEENKEKIKGTLKLNKELPAMIEVTCRDVTVTCTGEPVQAAEKQPLTAERAEACIRKTGNTPFVFEQLRVQMNDAVFLPVQALNALRREALDGLYEALMQKYRREWPDEKPGQRELPGADGPVKEKEHADLEELPGTGRPVKEEELPGTGSSVKEKACADLEELPGTESPEKKEAGAGQNGLMNADGYARRNGCGTETAGAWSEVCAGRDDSEKAKAGAGAEAHAGAFSVAVSVETAEQFAAVLDCDFVDAVYIDSICYSDGICDNSGPAGFTNGRREEAAMCLRDAVAAAHRAGKRVYPILPSVFRGNTADRYRVQMETIVSFGIDGFVVKGYDALAFASGPEGRGLPLILDHSLYSWNHEAKNLFVGRRSLSEPQPAGWQHDMDRAGQRHDMRTAGWQHDMAGIRQQRDMESAFPGAPEYDAGILYDTVPLELNRRELAARDNRHSEMLIYGYLPLMTSAQCVHANTAWTGKVLTGHRASSAQCVHANTAGCDRTQTLLYLKDRRGARFPVKNHCGACYNTIYNTAPLMLFDSREELSRMGIARCRLSFTVEDAAETARVCSVFRRTFLEGTACAREIFGADYTNGHFKRGVE